MSMEEKRQMRREMREAVAAMGLEERVTADGVIAKRVLGLGEVAEAETVCVYVALKSEVDTKGIIEGLWKMGKKVVVPRVRITNNELRIKQREASRLGEIELVEIKTWDDVEPGTYGILEPKQGLSVVGKERVGVFVVPGRAFSDDGGRLGRGGGYYDRLLEEVEVAKIGVCYSCQMVDKLVQMAHDVTMDMVISE